VTPINRFGRWQKLRCQSDGIPAIEVNVGQSTRNCAKLNADVLGITVELSWIVGALLPRLADWPFGFAAYQDRLPAPRGVNLGGAGDGWVCTRGASARVGPRSGKTSSERWLLSLSPMAAVVALPGAVLTGGAVSAGGAVLVAVLPCGPASAA